MEGCYILFESYNSDCNGKLYEYDIMGYTKDEKDAMAWRDQNPEYRDYKYCHLKEVVL